MKVLIPEYNNLEQAMVISLDFLTNREGKQCLWVQISLYLLSTFQAWYFGFKKKLTTVPQEVDSVVAGCRPGAWGRNDKKREPKFFKKRKKWVMEAKKYGINTSKQGQSLPPALLVYFLLGAPFQLLPKARPPLFNPEGSATSSFSLLDSLMPSPSFDELT